MLISVSENCSRHSSDETASSAAGGKRCLSRSEPKTGPGTLFIGARLEKGDLLISIYDDGVGMPSDSLAALQEELERPAASGKAETAHIGLLNVQHRIRHALRHAIRLDAA